MLDGRLLKELIKKDLEVSITENWSKEELQTFLSKHIDEWLVNNFEKLLNVIYRLDVSEEKFKKALGSSLPSMAIAALIVDRELQKIEFRKRYSSQ